MGCDIHLCVEVYRNGSWEPAGKMVRNEYWEPGAEGEDEFERESFYGDRNYCLFAILADVRNYARDQNLFAVVTKKVKKAFPVISEPRGLPDDVTAEVKEKSDRWGIDGHSHSWLSLRELLDFFLNPSNNELREYCSSFVEETIPRLTELCANPERSLDDVRIVFWFDN